MFIYFAYGLGIHSDLPLPEFVPSKRECDVLVRLTSSDNIPGGVWDNKPIFNISQQEAILSVEKLGTFQVRGGSEILVTPDEDADMGLVRQYIVGNLMAILLYQRGLLVLHASSINVDGNAVAFLGMAGSGKSSLAAALHVRGHELIADDVTAVARNGFGPKVFPGFPQFKLSLEAAQTLGVDPAALILISGQEVKRRYPVMSGFIQEAMPLSRVYVLAWEPTYNIERLPPQTAAIELIRHSVPTRFVQPGDAAHFQQCLDLVNAVPVFRLKRYDSIQHLLDLARLVEEHVLGTD